MCRVLHRGDDRREVGLRHQAQGDDPVGEALHRELDRPRAHRPAPPRSAATLRAAATGSAGERRSAHLLHQRGRRARAAEPQGREPREPAQLGDVGAKRLGVEGREHDEARPEPFGGRRRRVDRRVLAEVGDPPAAVAQREAESDQPEVVLLARRAGEHRDRPAAAAPAAGEGEQPPAHEVGGEVLLADADLLALPAIADVPHRRERDVAEHRVERERGDRAVEDGVGARLVERRRAPRRARPPAGRRSSPRASCSGAGPPAVEHGPRRLGGRQAALDQRARRVHAPLVLQLSRAGSRPASARASSSAVAALPGPQRVDPNPGSPRELTDPQARPLT